MLALLALMACGDAPADPDTGAPGVDSMSTHEPASTEGSGSTQDSAPTDSSMGDTATSSPGTTIPVDTAAVAACLETYAIEDGYGFEAAEPPSVDDIVAQCTAEGAADCELVVTYDAALCIAEAAQLPAGLEPWNVNLVYHHVHGAIIWNVASTEEQEAYAASGSILSIHAGTGDVLALGSWEASP